MLELRCYKTTQELLAKSFCQLAEKCYYSAINTCVIANNDDLVKGLDRVLWTYSKKHFIPHATDKDELHDQQPVYITSLVQNPNNSKIIIFVNPIREKILEALFLFETMMISKILIIMDDMQKINCTEINYLFQKSYFPTVKMDIYEHQQNGQWQRI